MKIRVFLFAAIAHLLLLHGADCWSFSSIDVLIAKGNGEDSKSEVYPVTAYQAWHIAVAALQSLGANTIEPHYSENYALTSFGPESCPCRTEAGVWVEQETRETTRVTIATKGRTSKADLTGMSLFPETIRPDFHKRFEEGVVAVKAGGSLPGNFSRQ